MDTRQARAGFFDAVKPRLAGLAFAASRASVSKDRVKLRYGNGATALLHLYAFRGDRAGVFGVDASVIVEGGPVRAVLDAVGSPHRNSFRPGWVLCATADACVPTCASWRFTNAADPERSAAAVAGAVAEHLAPLADAFCGGWSRALAFALGGLERPIHPYGASSPCPLAQALVLAALAREPASLDAIIAAAAHPWWRADAPAVGDPAAFLARAQAEVSRRSL